MQLAKKIYRLLPQQGRVRLASWLDRRKRAKRFDRLRNDILEYYDKLRAITPEQAKVVDFLRSHDVDIFPYDFSHRYDPRTIKVMRDSVSGLPYVDYEGKSLFFKRSHSDKTIQALFRGLLLDQDAASPHRYVKGTFRPEKDDILADMGAAEGNFSLLYVDAVRHVHLFEPDPEWVEALEATFAPWKQKVTIHQKFVGNADNQTFISLDRFVLEHQRPTFVKVDIEGAEAAFLDGAANFLDEKVPIRIAICTYHQQNDEADFRRILESHGFSVEHSDGYMIFHFDLDIGPPFLRRGILRAIKYGG